MSTEPRLQRLDRLVGTWTTEATHPAFPGVVRGTVVGEWLEGRRFLIPPARTDQPEFPDSISIIGEMGRDRVDKHKTTDATSDAATALGMHYFDSRGVFRAFDVSVDDTTWRIWRDAPGFSQRFTGTFGDGGTIIAGQWELRED